MSGCLCDICLLCSVMSGGGVPICRHPSCQVSSSAGRHPSSSACRHPSNSACRHRFSSACRHLSSSFCQHPPDLAAGMLNVLCLILIANISTVAQFCVPPVTPLCSSVLPAAITSAVHTALPAAILTVCYTVYMPSCLVSSPVCHHLQGILYSARVPGRTLLMVSRRHEDQECKRRCG
jgi:hypothetical protein